MGRGGFVEPGLVVGLTDDLPADAFFVLLSATLLAMAVGPADLSREPRVDRASVWVRTDIGDDTSLEPQAVAIRTSTASAPPTDHRGIRAVWSTERSSLVRIPVPHVEPIRSPPFGSFRVLRRQAPKGSTPGESLFRRTQQSLRGVITRAVPGHEGGDEGHHRSSRPPGWEPDPHQ